MRECPSCGDDARLVRDTPTPGGVVRHYRCGCGEQFTETRDPASFRGRYAREVLERYPENHWRKARPRFD